MPARITNFIKGACFAFYDEKEVICNKCKYSKSCKKATESLSCNEIRKIFKITNKIVDDLHKEWLNK